MLEDSILWWLRIDSEPKCPDLNFDSNTGYPYQILRKSYDMQ